MGADEQGTSVRREGWLFLALALLSIVPFWTSTYLPTSDGPCHLYNAWILREHDNTARHPELAEHYQLDFRPLPNWATHGVFALLLGFVSPPTAEKVLASIYVLTFLVGLWSLVGAVRPGSRWPAFLGFPFLFNTLFFAGLYNFSLSFGVVFFALALWWRGREVPTVPWALKLNLLLWLGWFVHVLAPAVSLLSIGVLWLTQLRRDSWRRALVQIPMLLPQVILPLWFLRAEGSEVSSDPVGKDLLLVYLLRLGPLVTFNLWLGVAATLLVMLFLALVGVTILRERRRRGEPQAGALPPCTFGFPLLAALFVALYFLGPDGMAGGWELKARLSLYPFLLLIPWFTRSLPEWTRRALIAVLALAASGNAALQVERYRALSPEIERYVRGLDLVEPGSRIVPLTFDREGSAGAIGIFNHAVDHAALAKGLIDWNNYEAASTLFPIRFRAGLRRPDPYLIEAGPAVFPLARHVDVVDYVYTWGMPASVPVARDLAAYYQPVATSDRGVLFRRKPAVP